MSERCEPPGLRDVENVVQKILILLWIFSKLVQKTKARGPSFGRHLHFLKFPSFFLVVLLFKSLASGVDSEATNASY